MYCNLLQYMHLHMLLLDMFTCMESVDMSEKRSCTTPQSHKLCQFSHIIFWSKIYEDWTQIVKTNKKYTP